MPEPPEFSAELATHSSLMQLSCKNALVSHVSVLTLARVGLAEPTPPTRDGITTVRDRCASLTGAARSPGAARAARPRAGPRVADRRGLAVIGWRPPPTHGSTYTRMLQPVTIGTMEITALASPTASSSMFKSTRGTSALPLASRRRRLWYTFSGRQQGHVRLACSRRVVASQSMVPEGRCATPAVLGIRPRHGYGHACRRGTKT